MKSLSFVLHKEHMSDTQTVIQELRDEVNEFRERREWENEDPKDIALSLILEAAELLEHFQWHTGEEVEEEARLYGPICDELADVLWWTLVMSDRLNIDLSKALRQKMEKNDKKYPVELFGKHRSSEEKRRAYYKVKAKTRGGHPLAEEDNEG